MIEVFFRSYHTGIQDDGGNSCEGLLDLTV